MWNERGAVRYNAAGLIWEDGVMRIIGSLLGILFVVFGGIWMLQGLGIAFQVGFMAGNIRWAYYGGAAVVAGIVLIVWVNTRPANFE